MKSLFLVSFFAAFLIFAGPGSSAFAHTDVSIPDANDMIQSDPNLIVVDVRAYSSEYCGPLGHIAGAINYPWNSGYFGNNYQDFAISDKLLLVCHSGNRSNSAATFLDSNGYQNVYDMLEGTNGWKNTYQYDTVDCVDSDSDGFNDDLDNCPGVYNPSQTDPVNLVDFALLAAGWLSTVDNNDLGVFALHWLADCLE